ncbi:MAG: hypothetical protein ACRCX8_06680 [Sarcina sp.]
MSKNKKWKRKTKRLIGASDVENVDCFFCKLDELNGDCQCACTGDYRRIEKYFKEKNRIRGGN